MTTELELTREQIKSVLAGTLVQLVNQEVGKEREACAALVEYQGKLIKAMFDDSRHEALISDLAQAIRNRGA